MFPARFFLQTHLVFALITGYLDSYKVTMSTVIISIGLGGYSRKATRMAITIII